MSDRARRLFEQARTKPLSPRMIEVMQALEALRSLRRYPSTPNEIAIKAGYDEGGRRHGNGAAIRSWSGRMPPSNRVNFALIALEKRGLIRWVARRDDLSGRAVVLADDPY